MINPAELEQKIKEIKPILEAEYLVEQIGYFGSFAKGDYREDSDVDIIVAYKRGIGWKFFDLKDFLESKLGSKPRPDSIYKSLVDKLFFTW